MSNPLDVSPQLAQEYQARFGAPPGAQATEAELARCLKLCEEALAERERLRAELARALEDRDTYLKAVYAYLRREHEGADFDKDALAAEMAQGPSLQELIEEAERAGGR